MGEGMQGEGKGREGRKGRGKGLKLQCVIPYMEIVVSVFYLFILFTYILFDVVYLFERFHNGSLDAK